MKNKLNFLPLLFATPFLFMGTSLKTEGCYISSTQKYGAAEITQVSFEGPDTDNLYKGTFGFKNNGAGYVDLQDSQFILGDNLTVPPSLLMGDYWAREGTFVLAPNKSGTFVSANPVSYHFELSEVEMNFFAFRHFEEFEYSEVTFETIGEVNLGGENWYGYTLTLTPKETYSPGYYSIGYRFIYELTVAGSELCIEETRTDKAMVTVYSRNNALVESDFVINNVLAFDAKCESNNGGRDVYHGGVNPLIIPAIIVAIPVVAALVTIPFAIINTKKKKNEEEK